MRIIHTLFILLTLIGLHAGHGQSIDAKMVLKDLTLPQSLISHWTYAGEDWRNFLPFLKDKRRPWDREESSDNNNNNRDNSCGLCNLIVSQYMRDIRGGASKETMTEKLVNFCTNLNLQPKRVCRGLVELNIGQLMFIIKNRPSLTGKKMCGVIFQDRNCYPEAVFPDFDFTIEVDPNKPGLTESKNSGVPPSATDLTIAHITDPHYDPKYQVGSLAACPEPSCCRNDQPIQEDQVNDTSVAANRWGDYRKCDSPLEAVEDAFMQIRRQHQNIDFLYFTGDIIDHGIWDTTEEGNKESITVIHDLLASTFAGIPVYPVIGNHESQPLNLFPPNDVPPEFSSQWLFDHMANEWSKWLPEDALETVRTGGYYTMLIHPGLRLIAMNNNDCTIYNWWLLYEPAFPRGQLQWIHDTLLKAEEAGEKVHIIGHQPPGDGTCFRVYGREYNRIVDRFWNTISGQFVGHTHADEFNLFYSLDNPSQAVNVMWNGGSTTTYTDVNPNYRIYTMDTSTFQVNGHETWIYNLTLANLTPDQSPSWFREYDFLEEYNLTDLSPASLNGLADTLARDAAKLQRYWELKFKMGDSKLALGCDRSCLGNNLCEMVTTEWGNSPRCRELRRTLDAA